MDSILYQRIKELCDERGITIKKWQKISESVLLFEASCTMTVCHP
jgi:hypothetical protein